VVLNALLAVFVYVYKHKQIFTTADKNTEELENDLIDRDKDSGENTLNEEDETNA
jgi:hypothetical protein